MHTQPEHNLPMLAHVADDADTGRSRPGKLRTRSEPFDHDPVDEFSTVDRTELTTHGLKNKVSVQYSPHEIVRSIEDDVENQHWTPVTTTVMVVDEDEILDHDTVANRERNT